MKKEPLISIITVCFNSEKFIDDTIKSILNQSYKNIQYIIIDGKSSDSTMTIVEKYKNEFGSRLIAISEKDEGIYDAMNKGILLAEGDIIGILNSDDFYTDNNVIKNIVCEFLRTNVDCVYANLEFVDKNDSSKVVRKWKTKKGDFKKGWNPPHPTTFIKKNIYNQYGLYKKEYKISSDYDLLYRIIEVSKVENAYLNKTIVRMRVGGRSTSGIKSNILGSKEIYNTLKANKQRFKLYIVLRRLVNKIFQFV